MVEKIIDTDDMCVIKWRLTDLCNYHCSYCIRRSLAEKYNNDFERCKSAVPYIKNIINSLPKKVKLDLIGGEISLFNLSELLQFKDCSNLAKINITTNLSKGADYFIKLKEALDPLEFTVTASFHPEFTEIDEFFKQAVILNNALKIFKVETVITNVNNQVDKFIELAEKYNLSYQCEEDMTDSSKLGQKSISSKKPRPRYLIVDNGNMKMYTTRNEFVKQYNGNFPSYGYYCTNGYNYLYIDKDIVVGHDPNKPEVGCHAAIPVKDFKLSNEPFRCIQKACTLCGHISLDLDKEDLKKMVN